MPAQDKTSKASTYKTSILNYDDMTLTLDMIKSNYQKQYNTKMTLNIA